MQTSFVSLFNPEFLDTATTVKVYKSKNYNKNATTNVGCAYISSAHNLPVVHVQIVFTCGRFSLFTESFRGFSHSTNLIPTQRFFKTGHYQALQSTPYKSTVCFQKAYNR